MRPHGVGYRPSQRAGWPDGGATAHDYRGIVATSLLAMHAAGDDVSWTVEATRRTGAAGDDLHAYSRVLRRFPGAGPFDGFDETYRTYAPTRCRGHLLP